MGFRMALLFLDFESGENPLFAQESFTELIRDYGIAVA
jgi:hypothetical protein